MKKPKVNLQPSKAEAIPYSSNQQFSTVNTESCVLPTSFDTVWEYLYNLRFDVLCPQSVKGVTMIAGEPG
jgi:hypothetical protein